MGRALGRPSRAGAGGACDLDLAATAQAPSPRPRARAYSTCACATGATTSSGTPCSSPRCHQSPRTSTDGETTGSLASVASGAGPVSQASVWPAWGCVHVPAGQPPGPVWSGRRPCSGGAPGSVCGDTAGCGGGAGPRRPLSVWRPSARRGAASAGWRSPACPRRELDSPWAPCPAG